MGGEVKQGQAKAEEKKEEKVEEKKEEKPAEEVKEEPKPPSPLVLYVNLHCMGCAKRLEKSIMRIRGVEGITIDMPQNQLTIKGIVEPQAVCEKIMKKTKRIAKVLSPLPATEGEPMPEVVTSQVSGLTTVELSVNMHCEACAEQLKKKILKMRGVRTVVTDLSTEKVTVTGTMDANKLVDYVYRRTKKQAKIVPQPEPEPQPAPQPEQPPAEEKKEGESKPAEKPAEEEAKPAEEKKEEEKPKEEKKEEIINYNSGEENTMRMMYLYQPVYVIEHIPPPQLFSDENPNACTIT